MHTIEATNIGTAWIRSIKTVLEQGASVFDDKGIIREVAPLYIHLNNPPNSDPVIDRFGDRHTLSFMERNFTDTNPIPEWSYSYAQRLFGGSNTIARIISILQHYPTAKSATLSLLNPEEDNLHTPCLTTLDFKIRHNTLLLHAFFRSQDIGNKFYADAVELLRLSKHVADNLLIEYVSIALSICSAHIYETDIPTLQDMLQHFP